MGERVAAGASLPVSNGLKGAEKDRNLPSGLRGWRAVTCRAVSAGLTPHPTDGRADGSAEVSAERNGRCWKKRGAHDGRGRFHLRRLLDWSYL